MIENLEEYKKVQGIAKRVLEEIKDFITVPKKKWEKKIL